MVAARYHLPLNQFWCYVVSYLGLGIISYVFEFLLEVGRGLFLTVLLAEMYNYYGLDTSLAPWLGGPISSSDTTVDRVGWMMESLVIDPVSLPKTSSAQDRLLIYDKV